ncbi:MAG TPA: aldo/keto reductase [Chitinophagaceae bacterium]|nr:aldo/keto reductase [Chitinophagaceae bacterium]
MEYQQLGRSDLNISRIGFGCMSLSTSKEAESLEMIHRAIESGINYFDTADMYDKGTNEMLLGKALRTKRDQVIIATKVGNQWRADGSGWDWNPRREYILAAIDESLKRLQTDHIDLYQLHGGTIDDPIDETIDAFEHLKKQGKIRFYGISSIRPNVIREWVARSGLSTVMMQYSLLDRRPEEEALPLLLKHEIGVLARGPMAQGLLVGKPAKDYQGKTAFQVNEIASFIRDQKVSASALSIQYVLRHPSISAAVVGIRTKKHLTDALEAISATPVPESLYQQLNQLSPPGFYTDHR